MATKPSIRIPLWGSAGTTTDPGVIREAVGWLVNERPPANWWNWLLNTLGQWVTYLALAQDETQMAYGRISVTGGAAAVIDGDAFNIDSALYSTTSITVHVDVPYVDGWVGHAVGVSQGGGGFLLCEVDNTGATTGGGGAGTRNLVVDLFDESGTAINPNVTDIAIDVICVGKIL